MKNLYCKFLTLSFFCCCILLLGQEEMESAKGDFTDLLKKAEHFKDDNSLKAIYYLQHAQSLKSQASDSALIQFYGMAGEIYFNQEMYELALKNYHEELLLQKKTNSDDQYFTLKNLGNIYYRLGDETKAKLFWNEALEGAKKSKNKSISSKTYLIYNNLAVLEQKKGNFVNALEIYHTAKEKSKALQDTLGLIMAYQNIGLVNMELKDFGEALRNLKIAETLSLQKQYNNDLANIYYNLGYSYHRFIENQDSATFFLNKAFQISDQSQVPLVKKAAADLLIDIYEADGDLDRLIYFLKASKSLSEEKLKEQNDKKIAQLEFRYTQKLREQELVSAQNRKDIFLIVLGILLLFSSILSYLIWKGQKHKIRRNKAEHELLIHQLEEKNRQLTEKNLKVIKSWELLDATKKKLLDLKETDSLKNKGLISQIISDLKVGTGKFNEIEFERHFKETHQEFYKNIIEHYPDLTRNELRLCAFLKLNLTTKEIAAITCQSYNSIIIARHRLKKKIGLSEKDNLDNHILKL